MATILQFAERLADGQDWTASERAQLRDVGSQLDGVDVVFGKSEMGDPWCVVTDDGGEVLLHVARIGGDFVVHATHDDEVVQDDDLWSAAKRLLGDMLKERRGVLLAFPPEALGQTAVLAFLFAAAMRGEFDHWMPTSRGDLPPPAEPHGGGAGISEVPPAPADPAREADHSRHDDTDGERRGGVIKEAPRGGAADALPPANAGDDGRASARAEETPAVDRSPAPAQAHGANAAPEPARPVPDGSRGGGAATGGSQAEVASFNGGGAGAAGSGDSEGLASGAGSSEPAHRAPLSEFVEGGEGDDRIAMSESVAAAGGRGADTFVLTVPTGVHGAPVLLGFVADFEAAEGDTLEFNGKGVVVVDRTETDLLSAVRTHPVAAAGSVTVHITDSVPVMAGRHIGYDLDGDGREDAYVLVTGSGGTWFTSTRPAGETVSANVGGVSGGPPGAAGPGIAMAVPTGESQTPIGISAEPLAASAGKEFLF